LEKAIYFRIRSKIDRFSIIDGKETLNVRLNGNGNNKLFGHKKSGKMV